MLSVDLLFSEAEPVVRFRQALEHELIRSCPLVFLSGSTPYVMQTDLHQARFLALHFSAPDYHLRTAIWEQALHGVRYAVQWLTPEALAGKFQFTPGQIRRAVAAAQDSAVVHGAGESGLPEAALLSGCRAQCNQKLSSLAEKITLSQ